MARSHCCVTLFVPTRAALAQNPTFNIEGVVHDAQQAVLPGVTVTITNTATGLTRTVVTADNGRYVVRALPPEGRYRVQVELTGFATQVRQDLAFNAGQNVLLNFKMQLSTVQETITVAGEAPIVSTTSSEVASTIGREQFETLPVKERNYFRLMTLDSNVVATGTGSNALNVGGQEVWNFGTYVDGTNNHSKWLTLQRAPQLGSSGFAIETVKEVQLITNQFSAEFGGHSAGVASMITKSGTNVFNGSGFVMIRPGDLDAAPPLAPIVNGEKVKAPYNQQQFGGTAGGPIVRDKMFFFGSYERRRERSEVIVTAAEMNGTVIPTPADEHQGHAKLDLRFNERQSFGLRYNMVRWNKDNEGGGQSLPGTGFIWDNNVDTVHATYTTVISDRMLNEVRGQYSRYTDSRAAKCECVNVVRQGYSTSGGNDQGTWGVLPEQTYDLSTTFSMWRGNHTMKTGASFTYDVTEQLFAPLQNGRYSFAGSPTAAPNPFQFSQAFALNPDARLMFPKAYVLGGFFQDDWRIGNRFTVNLGLRYDVEIIKDIPDWPAGTDANNIDPRVGFAWDPKGDQKWAVRGGVGRFSQQHPIFTIVKGGVGGRNGLVTLSLSPTDPLFPTFPNVLPGFPPGAVLPARSIQEISPDLENEQAWQASFGVQRQIGPRTSVAIDANINRGIKHGFLDMNAPAPIPKDQLNAALATNPSAIVRTQAQADLTRPQVPGAERLPPHGRAHQRRPLVVPRRPLLGDSPDGAAVGDGVVHVLESRGHAQSLVLAGEQPGSGVGSRADRIRYAAQPGHQPQLEHSGQRRVPERLAAERRDAQPERRAVHDPLRRRSGGLRRGCRRGLQRARLPAEHAGRPEHGARDVHELGRPDDRQAVPDRGGPPRVPRRRVQHVQQPEPARGRHHQPGR